MAATVLAAGLAWLPATRPGTARGLLLAVGGTATVLTLVALIMRRPRLLVWPPGLLLASYALSRVGQPQVDGLAPLVAGGLVLWIQLAYGSVSPPAAGHGRWTARTAALVGATVVSGAAVLAVARASVDHGLLIQAAGVGAAAGMIAVLAHLVRRHT